MSIKRLIGLVILIIGIVLIAFSLHSMNRISKAKGGIRGMKHAFSGSSTGTKIGDAAENKVSQYDTPVMILLISGIILAIVGSSVIIFGKKKKR
jgi:hypothetical protein